MEKIDKKRSIGEVAEELGIETHVIRFWESKFPQIKPKIGKGSRRYYFDHEIAVLKKIKSLLHDEGYSIAGLQKVLNRRKFLQKQLNLKEQNIEDLLEENFEVTNEGKFSIDDFINKDAKIVHSKSDELNGLIVKIEENLKDLEKI
jgi:DNA-binding transcriptional MerR regulator